jgi:hypothetical protein
MKYVVGIALIVIGAGWQGVARAEVSEDLKFCAALRSSKERLGCYDAAMRLAGPAPVTVMPIAEPVPGTLPATPKTSRFGGLYAGVTGGYEFANSKTYTTNSRPFDADPILTPFAPIDSLKGPKIGGLFGYNAEAGNLLLGFEGRAQYSFSKSYQADLHAFPALTFPMTLATCGPNCKETDFISRRPFTYLESLLQSEARNHRWQVDVSARTGIIFGDWMLYAKTGVGLEDSLHRTVNSATIGSCDPIIAFQTIPSSGDLAQVLTGCKSITRTADSFINTERTVAPVAILGGGVERNFGSFFLRAEGEFTAHFMKGGGVYYSPSANVAAGYRF